MKQEGSQNVHNWQLGTLIKVCKFWTTGQGGLWKQWKIKGFKFDEIHASLFIKFLVCICMYICSYVYRFEEAISQPCILFLRRHPPCFLKQGANWDLRFAEYAKLIVQQFPGNCLVLTPQYWDYKCTVVHGTGITGFYVYMRLGSQISMCTWVGNHSFLPECGAEIILMQEQQALKTESSPLSGDSYLSCSRESTTQH